MGWRRLTLDDVREQTRERVRRYLRGAMTPPGGDGGRTMPEDRQGGELDGGLGLQRIWVITVRDPRGPTCGPGIAGAARADRGPPPGWGALGHSSAPRAAGEARQRAPNWLGWSGCQTGGCFQKI